MIDAVLEDEDTPVSTTSTTPSLPAFGDRKNAMMIISGAVHMPGNLPNSSSERKGPAPSSSRPDTVFPLGGLLPLRQVLSHNNTRRPLQCFPFVEFLNFTAPGEQHLVVENEHLLGGPCMYICASLVSGSALLFGRTLGHSATFVSNTRVTLWTFTGLCTQNLMETVR